MKRFPRLARAVLIAVPASLFLAAPVAANAAPPVTAIAAPPVTAIAAPPVTANAVPAITSCPLSNAVCFYNSDNFNNLLGDAVPSSCNIPRSVLPAAFRNVINSVRNRTGCVVRLWYFCGTSVCLGEKMVPESEDGVISPVNAIDEISFSTS